MKKYKHSFRTKTFLTVLFCSAVIFSGCSVWTNFTTYFNLYYNASQKFDEAETQIKSQSKELFTLDEVKASSGNKSLTEVIEKLSKILQFYSTSSYVDDALLMIGKTFYYQGEFQKALRKFNELLTKFPESDLVLETQLWVGKTNFRLKNYDEGNKVFEIVKERATKEDENEIFTEACKEQISYFITIEDYANAILNAQKLVEVSGDETMNAAVMYEVGKLYVKTEQLQNAAKAFASVQDHSPDFETDYKSRLEYGKVQKQLGNAQNALDIFENLKSKTVYNDYLDQTNLQIGLVLMDLKRNDEAFSQLAMVDTMYKQSQSSGIAKYYLGLMLETSYKNYDSAGVYYTKATTSNAPTEILEEAKKRNLLLTKYCSLRTSIVQNNKQLWYLEKPEDFVKDSISYAKEQALIDSLNKIKQQEREENPQNSDPRKRKASDTKQELQKISPKLIQPIKPKMPADSIHFQICKSEYELGSLFFTELNQFDSAYYYYSDVLQKHPQNRYTGQTLFALGTYYETINNKNKADSLYQIVYDNYKTESIVNAAADKLKKPIINLKYDPIAEQYHDAETKIKEEKYREAIAGFRNIYTSFPKSPFAPRALCYEGWIYENKLKQLDSAAVVYDTLNARYSTSKYAVSVLSKLNAYKSEKQRLNTVQDTSKIKTNLKNIVAPEIKDSLTSLNKNTVLPDSNKTAVKKDINILPKDNIIIKKNEKESPSPVRADSLKQRMNREIPQGNTIPKPDTLKDKPKIIKGK